MRDILTVFTLWTLELSARRLGVRRTLAVLDRIHALRGLRRRAAHAEPGRMQARRMAARIDAADRRFSIRPGSCLPRSLLLYAHLRGAGHKPSFRLGVRTLTGVFESHAWVEIDGEVVNDADDIASVYSPMDWPGPGRS